MSIQKPLDWTSGQYIALFLFAISAVMATFVFWVARNDHDMKLLALGAVLGFISGSSGTASAILVGKPMAGQPSRWPDISELTPGGTATSTQTVQAPVASDGAAAGVAADEVGK